MIDLQVQTQYEKWMSKSLDEVVTLERKDKAKVLIAMK